MTAEDLFAEEGDGLFADEGEAGRETGEQPEPWKVLIVDDDPEVHEVTQFALSGMELEGRSLTFLNAYTGAEGREQVRANPDLALAFVDVVMETDDAGLRLARAVREELDNRLLRIVLRTGQPGMAPEKQVILDYDINDYKTKAELTSNKLFTTVVSALRAFRDMQTIEHKSLENARLCQAQSRFVPDSFLERLGRSDISQVSAGEHVTGEMAVLFADLRAFTTLAEERPPQGTIDLLNSYFHHMDVPIRDNEGFIDKFAGDQIMALFPNEAEAAVKAGVGMFRALHELNARLELDGGPALGMGTGINVGPLVMGTVGSQRRIECTVVGDTVNTAARLEQLTKSYGVRLLVGEPVVESLSDPDAWSLRWIDRTTVRGRSAPLGIYEVLDAEPAAVRQVRRENRDALEQGISRCLAGDTAEARRVLEEVLERDPEDPVARLHFQQCSDAKK